ncbi:MAG: GNAT family N-acetyltransferase [Chloroflexi bacterium]|jgi:phosphinothricin acetyltransferase|nr:GNAT family N-acetyltransferase [Chloroflexota bacterium]
MNLTVDKMRAGDWQAVRRIYQEGLETGQATFETDVPSWEVWNSSKHIDGRLVAKSEDKIVGWAALSPVSKREVYAGVAEVSIYVTTAVRGEGIGKLLLRALVEASEQAGIWTLQASVFPENETSVALHAACGFRIVGQREHIARHHGVWRNTILLERRSQQVGR